MDGFQESGLHCFALVYHNGCIEETYRVNQGIVRLLSGIVKNVCVIAMLTLLMPVTNAFAAWQVTAFEVYEGPRVKAADWREREAGEADPTLNPAIVREIENYLFAVASQYSTMGFADPVAAGALDSLVRNKAGEPVIRVYVYPHPADNAPYAFYTSGQACSDYGPERRTLNINTNKFARGDHISDTDYATLAHELFHAVMHASPFMRNENCRRGTWITEGMPDAISHYMARKLRNAQFKEELTPGNALILKVYGGRDYSEPLNKPAGNQYDYLTSSFWRHLAEVTAASRRSEKHPGAKPYQEHYGYLVDFLGTRYPFGPGPTGEITWLDDTMRKHEHIRSMLAPIYADFVAAFADHVEWRINPAREKLGLPPSSTAKWLRQGFSGCTGAAPVERGKPSTLELYLSPNTAGCFRINTSRGLIGGNVRIQITSDDLALLKRLRIGMPDGSLVSAGLPASRTGDNPVHVAEWNFPLLRAAGENFLISNMADQPATTRPARVLLHLSTDSWESSMTSAPPVANSPPPVPTAGRSTRREQQKQRTRRAIAKPLENLKPVTKVERKLYDRECGEVRRRFNQCSSQLVISLSLSPLVLEDNALAGQTAGGELLMEAFSAQGGGASVIQAQMQAGQDVDRYLRGIDASRITLSLPQLDYGFTGNLDNASVEVSRAGGDSYLSYGPRLTVAGQRISKPPNGRVTIEEYTPLIIRGTFSADLVDPDNPGPDVAPIVSRSITGSFLSASPYRLDRDFDVDGDQVVQEGLNNSLRQAPFGAGVTTDIIRGSGVSAENLCAQGVDEDLLKKLGFSAGCGDAGGGVVSTCSCDCERRQQEEEDPRCRQDCRRSWKNCPLYEGEFPADLEGQVMALRQMMSRQGLPAEMQETMVDAFRDAPAQVRMMMLESYR